jgi:thiol-disulfide isomerase/thioredoxin
MRVTTRVRWFGPLLAVAALALLASGCGGGGGDQASAPEKTFQPMAIAEGIAPDFELSDLSGRQVSLSESDGRVRLVDFWATWCAPCRKEIPMLNELHRTYGSEGLTILAISEENPEVVREFAEEVGVEYANLIDRGDVSQRYEVLGLPTAFLIDREGRIVETYMGEKPREQLEERIRELLDQPASSEG